MANNTGVATVDFGSFPGANEASVVVSGQVNISSTSKADVFVMADDSTSDHTTSDHRYLPCFVQFTCGTPNAANGFTIYGRSTERMQGTFLLRWVWAD